MKYRITVKDEYNNYCEEYISEEDLSKEDILNQEIQRITKDFNELHPTLGLQNLTFEYHRLIKARLKKDNTDK